MRTRIRFIGRVQGVGFRATARDIARGAGLVGWVENEEDGSVLLEAQGPDARVDAFVEKLMRRMDQNVTSIDRMVVAERVADVEAEFEIRR